MTSWRSFEWARYAPDFTQEEEFAAREEGYASARERWEQEMEFKSWVHYHESVPKRGRAQVESDLNSVGVPYERLGALSQAANALPDEPNYYEPEPSAPKDPAVRAGRIHGVQRHVADLIQAFEDRGIDWRTATDDDTSCPERADHLRGQWKQASERLAALGEDIDEMAEAIDSGELEVTEFVNVDVPPEDPELRRVYKAHEDWARVHDPEETDSEEEPADDSQEYGVFSEWDDEDAEEEST